MTNHKWVKQQQQQPGPGAGPPSLWLQLKGQLPGRQKASDSGLVLSWPLNELMAGLTGSPPGIMRQMILTFECTRTGRSQSQTWI